MVLKSIMYDIAKNKWFSNNTGRDTSFWSYINLILFFDNLQMKMNQKLSSRIDIIDIVCLQWEVDIFGCFLSKNFFYIFPTVSVIT